jgi:hypothetical protein
MADNIDGTQNGAGVYNTKIPAYSEPADIQAALKLYHYGSEEVPSDIEDVEPKSIAGYLKAIEENISDIEATGIGSDFTATMPTNVPDGFIWVDSDANLGTDYFIPSVEYQEDAPTTNLTNGMLWVEKGSTPLTMYVYDAEDEEWKEIGA